MGTDWVSLRPGIFSGVVDGKRVSIIGVDSFQNDLSEFAEFIYDRISIYGWGVGGGATALGGLDRSASENSIYTKVASLG